MCDWWNMSGIWSDLRSCYSASLLTCHTMLLGSNVVNICHCKQMRNAPMNTCVSRCWRLPKAMHWRCIRTLVAMQSLSKLAILYRRSVDGWNRTGYGLFDWLKTKICHALTIPLSHYSIASIKLKPIIMFCMGNTQMDGSRLGEID